MSRRSRARLAQRLAVRLHEERKARGWTQEQAAERCGYGFRHYQKLEGAELNVTLATLERLAEAFGVDAALLLRTSRGSA